MTDEGDTATSNFALLIYGLAVLALCIALVAGYYLIFVKGGGLHALASKPIKGFS